MRRIVAQEYRANAKQCLSWAKSSSDPENTEAFLAFAAVKVEIPQRLPFGVADDEALVKFLDRPGGREAAVWQATQAQRAAFLK